MTDYSTLPDEEINRLVAERVMGWTFVPEKDCGAYLAQEGPTMTDAHSTGHCGVAELSCDGCDYELSRIEGLEGGNKEPCLFCLRNQPYPDRYIQTQHATGHEQDSGEEQP